MNAGGGSLIKYHIEDPSLFLYSLLSAAKKIDQEFGFHHTAAHSVRDAKADINKLVNVLHEKEVTPRTHQVLKGLTKLCNTAWIQETMA